MLIIFSQHYLSVDDLGHSVGERLTSTGIQRAKLCISKKTRNKGDSADMSSVLNQCLGPASPLSPCRIHLQELGTSSTERAPQYVKLIAPGTSRHD